MGSRLLIIVAAGFALAACSIEHHRIERPAAVAVAPAATTIVYTDPAPVTTVYSAPVATVYTTR